MATRRRALALGTLPLAMLLRGTAWADDEVPGAGREIPVADDDGLAAALSDARPGDHIVLADGAYGADGGATLAKGGTPQQPIVLRAARPLAARFAGRLQVRGDDVMLAGLVFTTSAAVGGDRLRVERCRFEDTARIALNISYGRGVTVAYCEFVACRGRGLSIDPNGKADQVSATHVHHNYFADFVGNAGDNAHEALQIGQIGQDALLRIGAIVEDNLFVDVSIDSETISVKSSGNTIRRNTFLDCRSRPTNRFGNDNLWHANWIEDCRGMWIYGAGHELAGNRVVGARQALQLMAGNTTPDAILAELPMESGRVRAWRPHCQNVTAIGNEAELLVVGKVIKAFGEPFKLPAIGTRIAGHVGEIELELEQDTRIEKAAPSGVPVAVKLAKAAVGPEA